jgi:hypothetical protein
MTRSLPSLDAFVRAGCPIMPKPATTPQKIEIAPGFEISRIVTGLWQVADMERGGAPIDVDQAATMREPASRPSTWPITMGAPRWSRVAPSRCWRPKGRSDRW